jgi:hypothetical protein
MKEFANTYTYFFSLLVIGMVMYLVGILLFYRFKKSILLSSIVAVPQGLMALVFFNDYWNSERITGGLATVEDFIFCFIAGGGAWISVLFVLHKFIDVNLNLKQVITRTFQLYVLGAVILTILYLSGIRNHLGPYMTMTLCGILVMILKVKYLVLWLSGSILFTVNYVLALLIVNALWPDFIGSWNLFELSGILFLGIPLEEIIFSFFYGASMAVCLGYILDARLINGKKLSGLNLKR